MIKVHHAGKMGDLLFALPVLRALARQHGLVHLTTSGLCHQLVPLLWEQPYFADVVLDETRPYGIPFETGITTNWEYYQDGEGLNLSIQPRHYAADCPASWTWSYAWLAGVERFEPGDFVSLPTLVNHRNWHRDIEIAYDGKPATLTARTMIVAPEVESLTPAPTSIWVRIIAQLMEDGYTVVVVGKSTSPDYALSLLSWIGKTPERYRDLRGMTTVPVLAKVIAEAEGFIGAHSLPWHLARLAGTPAVCLQTWREGLRRCLPIDTPAERCPWVEPKDWAQGVQWVETTNQIGDAHA